MHPFKKINVFHSKHWKITWLKHWVYRQHCLFLHCVVKREVFLILQWSFSTSVWLYIKKINSRWTQCLHVSLSKQCQVWVFISVTVSHVAPGSEFWLSLSLKEQTRNTRSACKAAEKATRWLQIKRAVLWVATGMLPTDKPQLGHLARMYDVAILKNTFWPQDITLRMSPRASRRCFQLKSNSVKLLEFVNQSKSTD